MPRHFTADQVRDVLRTSIKAAGTQRELAAQLGVSEQYLSDVLRGKREPGPLILEGLGMRQQPASYVEK